MMMDFSFSDIVALLTLFLGGGSVGGFFTWQYARRKERAEAQQAETTAAKEMQDMYQQMVHDKQEEVEDNKRLIAELRQDRDHYKHDRDDLRRRLDDMEGTVRDLQRVVARNGRQLEAMRPLICTDFGCKRRKRVAVAAGKPQGTLTDDEEREEDEKGEMSEIEPINHDDI